MKLSNTMLISKDLLPSYNKAFTLAEVLITLTILGVVAAITIPSLINRQSEVAAKTKIKKALANFENVAAVYMAENEAQDIGGAEATGLYAKYSEYFKVVSDDSANHEFTTSDGAYWHIGNNNTVSVCDSNNSPKYCVKMWAAEGTVNTDGKLPEGVDNAEAIALPTGISAGDNAAPYVLSAKDFMSNY